MEQIVKSLDTLQEEANDLHIGTGVVELQSSPEPLEFARKYYAKQEAIVIRNALHKWPAVKKWTQQYLLEKLGHKIYDVAVTPNGYADGLAINPRDGKEYFVLPWEKRMTFSEFLKCLDQPITNAVYYIQKQNSNFSYDFAELAQDIDISTLEFATKSFNKSPDAINFWMGDERAITSLHKDPYDNLYGVISGSKDFILVPPHQVIWLPKATYPMGIYKPQNDELNGFYIEPIMECGDTKTIMTMEWISIDPLKPNFIEFPQYRKVHPIKVRLNAGDLLFLPNYWFHHVQQTHKCIAINFWYDMEYDSRYCYFRMLEQLRELI